MRYFLSTVLLNWIPVCSPCFSVGSDNTINFLLLFSGLPLDCALVNIILCLAPRKTMPFLREEQVQIMVVGNLEKIEVSFAFRQNEGKANEQIWH